MDEIWFGIVTAPRPTDYLDGTVKALSAAGEKLRARIMIAPTFQEDHASCLERYPNLDILPPLWPRPMEEVMRSVPDHRGLELNSSRLLNALCQTGAPWFVACQDDIVCSRRTVDRIACTRDQVDARKEIGAVSFYTPYAECGQSTRALWRYPDNKFYGDLCMLWRRRAAEQFACDAEAYHAHDLDICRFFMKNRADPKWQLWSHSPCLVQHVGLHSSTGKPMERRGTMNFNGENHDAISQHKPW